LWALNLIVPDKSYSRNASWALNLIVPDKGYSRNALWALNLTSTIYYGQYKNVLVNDHI
jgi:hypothetical protein